MRRPAPSRRAAAGWALAGLAALAVSGCAARGQRSTAGPPPHCAFTTCETDLTSLARLTAQAVGARLDSVAIVTAEPQFSGAVLVWRATVAGKRFICREGRNPTTGVVHYVTCQPSTDTGPLTAFE